MRDNSISKAARSGLAEGLAAVPVPAPAPRPIGPFTHVCFVVPVGVDAKGGGRRAAGRSSTGRPAAGLRRRVGGGKKEERAWPVKIFLPGPNGEGKAREGKGGEFLK